MTLTIVYIQIDYNNYKFTIVYVPNPLTKQVIGYYRMPTNDLIMFVMYLYTGSPKLY